MKTDREFLDGVYRKAHAMQEEKDANSCRRPFQWRYAYAAACAALLLFAALGPGFLSGGTPSLQSREQNISQVRGATAFANIPPEGIPATAHEADLIVTGVVVKTGKGTVEIEIQECLKGRLPSGRLTADCLGEEPSPAQEVLLFLADHQERYVLLSGGFFTKEASGSEESLYSNSEESVSLGALRKALAQND